jgi:putative transcriptional regulator
MDGQTGDAYGYEADGFPRYLAGHFLVSEAELTSRHFYHTVILLITHDEDGAFGLVVNRPADVNLGVLVEDLKDSPSGEIPVYVGGPVQQEYLFVLHSGLPSGVRGDRAISPADGVTFEPASEVLLEFLRNDWTDLPLSERPEIRLYAGYAGWAPEQLESELERESWIVLPATADIVFDPQPEEGWGRALTKKGKFYEIIAKTGFKPSRN